MKVKQLGLRVLSTAAIMSIVTSIAAPAFADIYYIGEGDINITVEADGTIKVNDKVDSDGNVIIRGGTAADYEDSAKESTEDKEETPEATTIGESEPVTQEAEEETPAEEEPEEEPVVEEQTEETEETAEEPKAEEEAPAEEEEPEEETSEEEAEEEQTTEETSEKLNTPTPQITDDDTPLAAPVSEDETPVESETETTTERSTEMGNFDDHYIAKTPASSAVDKVITVVNNWVDNVFKFTIENINIKNTDRNKAAMSIQGKGDTTIELDGNNVLENTSGNHAALEKNGNETGTLTITDSGSIKNEDGTVNNAKRGSLTAKSVGMGAAIGGGSGQSGENITIDGNAYVSATGTRVGIGGGRSYGNGYDGNNITIQGNSYVVAKGSDRAIGGSNQSYETDTAGNANNIRITGTSTVYADGGIGSGGSDNNNVKGGNTTILIDGQSTVYAQAKGNNASDDYSGAAAIGSGHGGNADITIGGQAKVKATITTNPNVGVGIGSRGKEGTVTIKDEAIIGDGSSGIGASGYLEGAKVTVNIRDRATIGELVGSGYIGSGSKKASSTTTVNIWNDVIIKKVLRIGSNSGKAIINILDNATIKSVGGTYWPAIGSHWTAIGSQEDGADITIGGSSEADKEQTGIVTINATTQTSDSHGIIGGDYSNTGDQSTVKINGNVDLVLRQNGSGQYIRDLQGTGSASGKELSDEEIKEMLGQSGSTITYLDKDGKTTKIAHSTDLCEPAKDSEMEITTKPTCSTTGVGKFTCGYEKNHGATGEGGYYCTRVVEDYVIPKDPTNHVNPETGEAAGTYIKNAKEATCTEDGYTGDTYCEGCDALIQEGEAIPATGHAYGEWEVTTPATCTEAGEETRVCANNESHIETREIEATGHDTEIVGKKDPTETEPGYTGDEVCKKCGETVKQGEVIPALGLPDDDNKGGTTVTEAAAPELWVTAPDTIRQVFHVTQSGTTRTYTSPYNSGTLTGTMEILQYLQEQGVETIVFTTNQRTSRFAVADLLALVNEGDVFYLSHMDANEPTLLVVTNDHTDLLG